MRNTQQVVAAILSSVCLGHGAWCQAQVWSNPAGGQFGTGSNWSTGTVPNAGTSAVFSLPGVYGVSFESSRTVNQMIVTNGDVTMSGPGSLTLLTPNSPNNAGLRVESPLGSSTVLRLRSVNFGVRACAVAQGTNTIAELEVGSGAVLQAFELVLAPSSGTGVLTVRDGGRVDSTAGIGIGGGQPATMGIATVTGAGSQISSQAIYVGVGGSGNMLVDAGARVLSTRNCQIGAGTGPGEAVVRGNGTVLELGSTFFDGDFLVGSNSDFRATGRLAVMSGARAVSNRPVDIRRYGTLAGNGRVEAAVLSNGGVIAPGASFAVETRTLGSMGATGTLTLTGNFVQSSTGQFQIELAGPGAFDQLSIGGTASLGGSLQVSLLDSYVPAIGSSFPILIASGRTGTFGTLSFPSLPADRSWSLTYPSGGVLITVIPEPRCIVMLGALALCPRRRRCARSEFFTSRS